MTNLVTADPMTLKQALDATAKAYLADLLLHETGSRHDMENSSWDFDNELQKLKELAVNQIGVVDAARVDLLVLLGELSLDEGGKSSDILAFRELLKGTDFE